MSDEATTDRIAEDILAGALRVQDRAARACLMRLYADTLDLAAQLAEETAELP